MIAVDTIQSLINPDVRAAGAPELAGIAGASHLCVFIRDPELAKFLPAPGFPQRLPKGLAWAQFLASVERTGHAAAELPSPYSKQPVSVSGSLVNERTILVLFGENVTPEGHACLAPAVSVLAALFLQETKTRLSEIQASVARSTAMESRKLAQSLSDVHDRLAAEFQRSQDLSEEVHRQQERLGLARRVSGVGEWQYHPETQRVTLSAQAAAIFGFGFKAVEPTLDEILQHVHPVDRHVAEIAFSPGDSAKKRADRNTQFRVAARDGSTRWVENRSTVFRTAEASKITVIGISLDITHRVLSEETLLRSEKLAAAGRLAASIAHEINNPLEGLVNLIYLAREENDIEIIHKLMGDADREAARVASVARQSLAFYRDVNHPIRLDLRSTVQEVVNLLAPQAIKHRVSLRMRIPDCPTEIEGWPGEMKQVISNLLLNAIHASTAPAVIWVRVYCGLNSHQIVVADQGHGIPAEIRGRIFEPFFSTRKDSGTGLGLWVTRQIVEKHGGSIRLRSSTESARHGTLFQLSLPAMGTANFPSNEKFLRFNWLELSHSA